MKFFYYKKYIKGFSLVEVLIACAIMATSVLALMAASTNGIQLSNQTLKQTQANFLLEEGAEAVKSIRDESWENISNITLNTDYYLTFDSGTNSWSLGTTPVGAIDSLFTRKVVFSGVSRDINDDIVSSGGSYDDDKTVKVIVSISWPSTQGSTSSRDLSFYISDIFN